MNPVFTHIRSTLAPVYGDDEAREMAFWILEEVSGLSRADVFACKDTKNISNIEIILQRLLKKEPIQYVFGHIFWKNLDLLVNSSTLIPRPETAELVDWVDVNPSARILDIGTGSGCIAIALKKKFPLADITGLDFSAAALRTANENAVRNGVSVSWMLADVLSEPIEPLWDVVVSNPPYVCESEKVSMDSNVLDWEPSSALFVPDADPLRFYRRIAQLKLGREIYFEINERFGVNVCKMLESNGYFDVQLKRDFYGKERMVRARIER